MPRAQGASASNEAEVRRFVVAVRYTGIYKGGAAGFVVRAVSSLAFGNALMTEIARMPAFADLGLTAPASGRK